MSPIIMELVKGYRFFSEDVCQQVKQYCDEKEKQIRRFHQALVESGDATDNPKIPVTQRYHCEYNFFGEPRIPAAAIGMHPRGPAGA